MDGLGLMDLVMIAKRDKNVITVSDKTNLALAGLGLGLGLDPLRPFGPRRVEAVVARAAGAEAAVGRLQRVAVALARRLVAPGGVRGGWDQREQHD